MEVLAKSVVDLEPEKRRKLYQYRYPKGVDDGTRIRLAGKGEAGSKGGADGDLYVYIQVKNTNCFKEKKKIFITSFQYL